MHPKTISRKHIGSSRISFIRINTVGQRSVLRRLMRPIKYSGTTQRGSSMTSSARYSRALVPAAASGRGDSVSRDLTSEARVFVDSEILISAMCLRICSEDRGVREVEQKRNAGGIFRSILKCRLRKFLREEGMKFKYRN